MTLYEFVARFSGKTNIDIEVEDMDSDDIIQTSAFAIQEYEIDNKWLDAYVESWYISDNEMCISVCL